MIQVDLSKDQRSIQHLLDLANEDNLILRSSEGKEYILAELDDFDREIELMRNHPELMAFLDERYKEKAIYPLEEVKEK